MAIKLSQLLQPKSASLRVTLAENGKNREESLSFRHHPVSPALAIEIDQMKEEGSEQLTGQEALQSGAEAILAKEKAAERTPSILARQVARLLVDLDLVDEAGKPVKPTANFLDTVEVTLLRRIFDECFANSGVYPSREMERG